MSDDLLLVAIRLRDTAWRVPCAECGQPTFPGDYMHVPLSECPRVKAGEECFTPTDHHAYVPGDHSENSDGDQAGFDRRALLRMLDVKDQA